MFRRTSGEMYRWTVAEMQGHNSVLVIQERWRTILFPDVWGNSLGSKVRGRAIGAGNVQQPPPVFRGRAAMPVLS